MAIGIHIYDYKEIDISSPEIRENISIAVKDYIVEHWDECVTAEKHSQNGKDCAEIIIEL